MKLRIMTDDEVAEMFNICGAPRGRSVHTKCELKPGHDGRHLGRGRLGQWFSW